MAEQFEMKGWLKVANGMMVRLVKLGFSPNSTVLLTVPGRKSGVPRTTPVSVVRVDGERYIQTPYGERDWVRNLRAAGGGNIQVGRKVERVTVDELSPSEAVPVLRQVLRMAPKFLREHYDITADAAADEIEREAPKHPVFRLRPAT